MIACGFTLDGLSCDEVGDHFCEIRANHVCAFIEELCVHTKSQWARKPFILEPWQRDDIIRPIFGTVIWSPEREMYIRQYRVVWIEIARKQGKSELAAAVALYMLIGDSEESAEVYGAAKDRLQGAKVWEVAARMVQLSPILSKRIKVQRHTRRIIDEQTNSYYETISRDAKQNLGHNPSSVIFDEVVSQPDGELWDSLRTSAGTRPQMLIFAITTAGTDASSYAGQRHKHMARVADGTIDEPSTFVYQRNTPMDADPWDEDNWFYASPALRRPGKPGGFASLEEMRIDAREARNDPVLENAFRVFKLNQWTQSNVRFLSSSVWEGNTGRKWKIPDEGVSSISGTKCYGGLDLSAKMDLTSFCVLSDEGEIVWRFWLPEAYVPTLAKAVPAVNFWAREGWLTVTEGDVIDYKRVYDDIAELADLLPIVDVGFDPWSGANAVQGIQDRCGLEFTEIQQTYDGLGPATLDLKAGLKKRDFEHHGNPVANWHASVVEVKSPVDNPDRVRPVKPDRSRTGQRIDGVVALIMALDTRTRLSQVKKKRTGAAAFF